MTCGTECRKVEERSAMEKSIDDLWNETSSAVKQKIKELNRREDDLDRKEQILTQRESEYQVNAKDLEYKEEEYQKREADLVAREKDLSDTHIELLKQQSLVRSERFELKRQREYLEKDLKEKGLETISEKISGSPEKKGTVLPDGSSEESLPEDETVTSEKDKQINALKDENRQLWENNDLLEQKTKAAEAEKSETVQKNLMLDAENKSLKASLSSVAEKNSTLRKENEDLRSENNKLCLQNKELESARDMAVTEKREALKKLLSISQAGTLVDMSVNDSSAEEKSDLSPYEYAASEKISDESRPTEEAVVEEFMKEAKAI